MELHPVVKQRCLIIGGGLAGLFLSVSLLDKGHRVFLLDDGHPSAASKVAAGLFNVITGRFGAKSWMADRLLPAWISFMNQPRFHSLKEKHVHFQPIYRPFKEIAEYNKWTGRSREPAYENLVEFRDKPYSPDKIHNPHGGIMILPCGWVDIAGLIPDMKNLLSDNPDFEFLPIRFTQNDIDLGKRVFYGPSGKIQFDQLIFCEGYRGQKNILFPKLPIIPNKGELLVVEAPDLKADIIFSRKVYLIPLGGDRYLTGSTYFNQFADPHPSKRGREEICMHLEKLIRVPYKIVDHKAGIRPTTPDRRPILGTHPQHSFVHVFTGFGTKGVLLAPYFSDMMGKMISDPSALPIAEVHLNRFRK